MKYGLDEVKTFLAVVENGSISGAATRLGIAKSVVSSRGVTPTDRGRVFHVQACAAIAQLEQAAEAVTDDEGALSGLLRISVPMTFGTHYLSPILCEFMRVHPRLELALDLSDRMVDVAAEGYDLAIRITRIKEDSLLVARKLADSRRAVCCSPSYAKERGLPKTLGELPQHAGIGYAHPAANHLWQFAPARRMAQLHIATPKGRILTNNGEAMRDAAVAGLGLAALPLFIVAEDLRAGRLIHVLPRETPIPDAIYAVYPQRRHKLRRLSALVEHLRNALAGVPPWERHLSAR